MSKSRDSVDAIAEAIREDEEARDALAEAVVEQMEVDGSMPEAQGAQAHRRDVLKTLGLLGTGAAAGALGGTAATQEARAADTSVGQIGSDGSPVDVALDQLRDPGGDEVFDVDDSGDIVSQRGFQFPAVTTDAIPNVADHVVGANDDAASVIENDASAGDVVSIGGTHEFNLSNGDSAITVSVADLTLIGSGTLKVADNQLSGGDEATLLDVQADGFRIADDLTLDGNKSTNTVTDTSDFELIRVTGGRTDISIEDITLTKSPGKTLNIGNSSNASENVVITKTKHEDSIEGSIIANTDGVRFVNNEARNITEDGVEPTGSTNILISDSVFVDIGREAVDLFDGNTRAVVADCTIDGIGSDAKSPGVSVAASSTGNKHVVIANLTIDGVTGDAPAIGVGVEFQGGTNEDVLITDNEIDHSRAYKIQDATDVRIEGGKHSSAVTTPLEVVDADASAPISYDGPQLQKARRPNLVPTWVDVAWQNIPLTESLQAVLSTKFTGFDTAFLKSNDEGSSFTFSLTDDPVELDVSHSGGGSGTFGWAWAPIAIMASGFDTGFRLWFRNVTYSENDTGNELYVGLTDRPNASGSDIRDNGIFFYRAGGSGIFRVDGSNNGAGGFDTTGSDIAVEWDGSTASLYVENSSPKTASYSNGFALSPIIMAKDVSGNSQSETITCERIEIEPL
jgi:hypothetical protein